MRLNDLPSAIIGAAIKVHRTLGPGLLESAYRTCLAYDFHELAVKDGIKRVVNDYTGD